MAVRGATGCASRHPSYPTNDWSWGSGSVAEDPMLEPGDALPAAGWGTQSSIPI